MIHRGEAALIFENLQAQNFARRTFGLDFEGMAADLAVNGETLAGHAGVHHRLEGLPAVGALDGSGDFHIPTLARLRREANLDFLWFRAG